jgi:hypothetical protein
MRATGWPLKPVALPHHNPKKGQKSKKKSLKNYGQIVANNQESKHDP